MDNMFVMPGKKRARRRSEVLDAASYGREIARLMLEFVSNGGDRRFLISLMFSSYGLNMQTELSRGYTALRQRARRIPTNKAIKHLQKMRRSNAELGFGSKELDALIKRVSAVEEFGEQNIRGAGQPPYLVGRVVMIAGLSRYFERSRRLKSYLRFKDWGANWIIYTDGLAAHEMAPGRENDIGFAFFQKLLDHPTFFKSRDFDERVVMRAAEAVVVGKITVPLLADPLSGYASRMVGAKNKIYSYARQMGEKIADAYLREESKG